ncbi:MAG TPA: hypothetical protein DEF00_05115 [Candidatus Taylorbacteria bacterium]|nr:hypothetical protein [Candidatus Taylorbacteria bacterium]
MSISKWLGPPASAYTQHRAAVWFLRAQVRWRFGKDTAREFNPETDVKNTLQWWFLHNRKIILGEQALRGVTLVPVVENGRKTTKRKPRVVYLYQICQTIRR